MAALRIVGIALLVLGILSLAYQGITYTKSEKVLEVGPITATKETTKTIPLPPVLGGVALVGGLVGLVVSIVGAAVTWNKGPAFGPHWYPLALIVLAMPQAWLGGKLRLMQLRAPSQAGTQPAL